MLKSEIIRSNYPNLFNEPLVKITIVYEWKQSNSSSKGAQLYVNSLFTNISTLLSR